MKTFFLASMACTLAGCGGAIDTTLLDGGDGGSGSDASKDGAPTTDGGSSCDALYAAVQADLPAAIACCATCNSLQCTAQVDGTCCPVSVNSADSPAVKSYLAALKAFKDAKCSIECPALACSTKPSTVCDGNSQNGTCEP